MAKKAINENSINLLLNCTQTLKNESKYNVLKTYYMSKCKKLCSKDNVTLPNAISSETKRCLKCHTAFENTLPTYRVIKQIKKNRFQRRLQQRIKEGLELTDYQKKSKKKNQKKGRYSRNSLLIICKVCQEKKEIYLEKPLRKLINKPIKIEKKGNKKHKKKDVTAGLNAKYVLSNKSFKEDHPVPKTSKVKRVNTKEENKNKKIFSNKIKKFLDRKPSSSSKPSNSLDKFLNSLSY